MARTILLVESEPSFQNLYGEALSTAGYRVVHAQRGHQAAAMAAVVGPDLVLLNLSTLDPVEVDIVPRLQMSAGSRYLPVIAYYILGETDNIQRALRLGATDYFVHGPQAAPEMLRKVAYHLAAKPQKRY